MHSESSVSLRHARGFPALGLLRRLRPPFGTSPDLAVCRVSQTRRPNRGSPVPLKKPVIRQAASYSPGCADMNVDFGDSIHAHPFSRMHPVAATMATGLWQRVRHRDGRRVQTTYRGFRHSLRSGRFPPSPRHCICDSLPGESSSERSSQAFEAVRLLQVLAPISKDVHSPLLTSGPGRTRMASRF